MSQGAPGVGLTHLRGALQAQLAAATAAGVVLQGKKASLQRERKLLQRLAACEEELRQLRGQASLRRGTESVFSSRLGLAQAARQCHAQ